MRLAALSDIHGNLTAFDAVLADLEAAGGADTLWLLGDYALFGARPGACVARMQALAEQYGKERFGAISGNTDRYVVRGERPRGKAAPDEEAFSTLLTARTGFDAIANWTLGMLDYAHYAFLRDLRHDLDLHAPDYGYVIGYHAVPGDDETNLLPDTPDEEAADRMLDREGSLGIGGHTHRQMDRQVGGWRLVNIGSVGLSFDMPGKAQYGIFTFEAGGVTVDLRAVAYDVEAEIAALHAAGHPHPEFTSARLRPPAGG